MKLTSKERRAIESFNKARARVELRYLALQRKGLITDAGKLTKAGRAELKVPNILLRKKSHPDRALAAAEVLAAVWLRDDRFELEYEIDETSAVEGKDGNPWVTVRIQVPQLDVELWAAGEHCDQNKDEE